MVTVNKQIDDALSKLIGLSIQGLSAYEPKSIAEAMAKNLLTTAVESQDEALRVRTSQIVADRVDGRASAGDRKQKADPFRELEKAIHGK